MTVPSSALSAAKSVVVPFVVVGLRARPALAQRQPRLRAVQRLDLALLIHAQHQRPLRRRQIQPHDGLQFFGELRIPAQLEGSQPVRFEAVRPPDAPHARRADAGGARHQPHTPIGGLRRSRLRGALHDGLRVDARLAPGPWFFPRQGGEATVQEASTPAGDLAAVTTQLPGNLFVLPALGGQHDNVGAFHLTGGQRAGAGPLLQGGAIGIRQDDGFGFAHSLQIAPPRLGYSISGSPH